jgi:hypothetical protein
VTRSISFTQAEVRRAIKGAQSAGLIIRRITVGRDGAITLDSISGAIDSLGASPATSSSSWDDV